FEVFGRNTLFIYVLSILFVIVLFTIQVDGGSLYGWIARNVFMSWAGPYLGSLFFALWVMLSCWTVGYFMDKRGIYIKVYRLSRSTWICTKTFVPPFSRAVN